MENKKFTFEEIYEQNKRRVHYFIHKLNIKDPHQEYHQEGLVAMWNAYEKHQPNKGPLSTYFNYMIRNRLIDQLRKENRAFEKDQIAVESIKNTVEEGNYSRNGNTTKRIFHQTKQDENSEFWHYIKSHLTEKQWKWVYHYIIEEKSLREIAEQEGVTIHAVKSWRKEAKKKLQQLGHLELVEKLGDG